jgi:hypothetical protein
MNEAGWLQTLDTERMFDFPRGRPSQWKLRLAASAVAHTQEKPLASAGHSATSATFNPLAPSKEPQEEGPQSPRPFEVRHTGVQGLVGLQHGGDLVAQIIVVALQRVREVLMGLILLLP